MYQSWFPYTLCRIPWSHSLSSTATRKVVCVFSREGGGGGRIGSDVPAPSQWTCTWDRLSELNPCMVQGGWAGTH